MDKFTEGCLAVITFMGCTVILGLALSGDLLPVLIVLGGIIAVVAAAFAVMQISAIASIKLTDGLNDAIEAENAIKRRCIEQDRQIANGDPAGYYGMYPPVDLPDIHGKD